MEKNTTGTIIRVYNKPTVSILDMGGDVANIAASLPTGDIPCRETGKMTKELFITTQADVLLKFFKNW